MIFFLKKEEEYDGNVGNKPFIEMESSKSINYLINMCWSSQGTMVIRTFTSPPGIEIISLKYMELVLTKKKFT